MTQSGFASGNFDSWDDNLRPDQYENFATYLTRVVEYLKNELDIDIQTLSPINEPNNGYWGAGGRQEGSNWTYDSQAKIINEVARQLEDLNLDTVVSGRSEEHTSELQSRGHLVCRRLLEKKKEKHEESISDILNIET